MDNVRITVRSGHYVPEIKNVVKITKTDGWIHILTKEGAAHRYSEHDVSSIHQTPVEVKKPGKLSDKLTARLLAIFLAAENLIQEELNDPDVTLAAMDYQQEPFVVYYGYMEDVESATTDDKVEKYGTETEHNA